MLLGRNNCDSMLSTKSTRSDKKQFKNTLDIIISPAWEDYKPIIQFNVRTTKQKCFRFVTRKIDMIETVRKIYIYIVLKRIIYHSTYHNTLSNNTTIPAMHHPIFITNTLKSKHQLHHDSSKACMHIWVPNCHQNVAQAKS